MSQSKSVRGKVFNCPLPSMLVICPVGVGCGITLLLSVPIKQHLLEADGQPKCVVPKEFWTLKWHEPTRAWKRVRWAEPKELNSTELTFVFFFQEIAFEESTGKRWLGTVGKREMLAGESRIWCRIARSPRGIGVN